MTQPAPPPLNRSAIRAVLLAVQSQLEALAGGLAALMELVDPDDECSHDRKEDVSTIGEPPRFRCPDCGLEWQEKTED